MNRAQKFFLLICGAIAIFAAVIVVQDDNKHNAGGNASAEDSAILLACEQAACQKYAMPCNEAALANWHNTLSGWQPSIVRDGDNRAEVTFYSGNNAMDREEVARDESGEWHGQ